MAFGAICALTPIAVVSLLSWDECSVFSSFYVVHGDVFIVFRSRACARFQIVDDGTYPVKYPVKPIGQL